ncbi:MAG TPA: DUF4431 domain-containing protein [Labilithrix sp.]|nr:DUF4431 domain-containing protein [Labilithrix sp.]
MSFGFYYVEPMRLQAVTIALLLLIGCSKTAPSTSQDAGSAPAASLSTAAKPPPLVSASATVATKDAPPGVGAPGKCTALKWDGLNAGDASFEGTLSEGEASNATGKMEHFYLLSVPKPVCGPDGAAVTELHVYSFEKGVDLKSFVKKRVRIEGSPFAEHTAHHHRPIVVDVKKVAAAS